VTGNTDRTFTVAGYDITRRVMEAALVPLRKPAYGQLPTTEPVTLTVRSNDHAFDPLSPVSLLYGLRLDETPVVIAQGGITRWSGYLSDVQGSPDGRVTLTCETRIMARLNRAGRVDTTELLTPVDAAARMLAVYGIATDRASFSMAADRLTRIPVRCRILPSVLTGRHDG
jgi:hypothetical protein